MLKWRVLVVVGLSCGVAGVAWGYTQQARDPGFFELRVYTALPGQRDALAARFGDNTTKIYKRHGTRNVGHGFAASVENADRTFVYMRGCPSRQARAERLSAAHADPEFREVVTAVERDPATRLIESVQSLDLAPAQTPITTHDVAVAGAALRYLEAGPPGPTTVVLLHGARFTSETWHELGTIVTLAEAGHHVVALGLPGYGDSETSPVTRSDYLDQALEQLWPANRFVIVSPSMSGGFSLPFVARYPDQVAGYVPVAPVGIDDYRVALAQVDVPTLVVWGEDDQLIPVSQARVLAEALEGETLILAGAGHPAYLDRPDEFHGALLGFIGGL